MVRKTGEQTNHALQLLDDYLILIHDRSNTCACLYKASLVMDFLLLTSWNRAGQIQQKTPGLTKSAHQPLLKPRHRHRNQHEVSAPRGLCEVSSGQDSCMLRPTLSTTNPATIRPSQYSL